MTLVAEPGGRAAAIVGCERALHLNEVKNSVLFCAEELDERWQGLHLCRPAHHGKEQRPCDGRILCRHTSPWKNLLLVHGKELTRNYFLLPDSWQARHNARAITRVAVIVRAISRVRGICPCNYTACCKHVVRRAKRRAIVFSCSGTAVRWKLV